MINLLVSAAALLSPASNAAPASPTPSSQQNDVPNLVPIGAPPGGTLDITTGGSIALDVNEKKSELTLGYSWSRQSHQPLDDNGLRLYRNAFHVELSLPVGGKDNLLSGDTYRGLRNGPSLSGSWTWFSSRAQDTELDSLDFRDITLHAVTGCLRHADEADGRAARATAAADSAEQRLAAITDPDALRTAQNRARHLREVATEAQEGASNLRDECNVHVGGRYPTRQFAIDHSGISEAAINRATLEPGYAIGIEGSVGLDVFDYRTPVTLTEHSRTQPNFSIKTYFTYFPSDAMSMLTIAAEYRNEFKAQDEQILCPPVVNNPNDDCRTAPPGPPTNSDSLLLSAEYRRVLRNFGRLGQVAIAPRASIDALSGEYELTLPIYLRPRSDFGLLPGLSFTYNSEHDEFIVGVFLKRSFNF